MRSAGAHDPSTRQLKADAVEESAQGLQLLRVRRVVDAVHARLPRRLQRLGGGDVGGDHEFLDQPMAVEPVPFLDVGDGAIVVEDDPALGQIDLEDAARFSRPGKGRVGTVEGRNDGIVQGFNLGIRASVVARLHLLIGQARRRPHKAASETMAA